MELKNAITPYKAIDLIEEISNEVEDLENIQNEHYDVIMDAL
jgi:hypothetical protein